MSATGLEVFDKTLQTTNIWLDEISAAIGPDRHRAWRALSVVLRTLRDRMPVELAAHLGAELPLLVRGAYYDQFQPAKQPADWNLEDFTACVAERLDQAQPMNPRTAMQAVFATLSRHIPQGQIAKVQDALPKDLHMFWTSAEERVVPPPERAAARG